MTYKGFALAGTFYLWLALSGMDSAQAQQYVYRNVDVPGAGFTLAECNNNMGQIVGNYNLAGFNSTGENFLLSMGVFQAIKGYPGGESTLVTGINPSGGKIVGSWNDTSGKSHGFLLLKKKYTSIDYPGAVGTAAIDVNDAGDIVGNYWDTTAIHGFKLQSGTYTNIDPPGAAGSYPETINDSGQVVGYFSLTDPHVNTGRQGYLLASGSYTPMNYPGASETLAIGLNSSGQIVGDYVDGSGVFHGFTNFSGTFSSFDYPGATNSEALEINDSGQIEGDWYGSAPNFADAHGYVATPIPGTLEAGQESGTRRNAIKAR